MDRQDYRKREKGDREGERRREGEVYNPRETEKKKKENKDLRFPWSSQPLKPNLEINLSICKVKRICVTTQNKCQ